MSGGFAKLFRSLNRVFSSSLTVSTLQISVGTVHRLARLLSGLAGVLRLLTLILPIERIGIQPLSRLLKLLGKLLRRFANRLLTRLDSRIAARRRLLKLLHPIGKFLLSFGQVLRLLS